MRACGICFRVALGGALVGLSLPSGVRCAGNWRIRDNQINDNER